MERIQEFIRKKQKQPCVEVKRIFWEAEEDTSMLIGLRRMSACPTAIKCIEIDRAAWIWPLNGKAQQH